MIMNVGGKRAAPPPRKASPLRQNDDEEELTFKQKLDEIKRIRSGGSGVLFNATPIDSHRGVRNEQPIVPKQVQTVSGLKTFLKSFGSWVEVVSKSGKVYYYNKKTQQNQWKKPEEWADEEMRLNPPLPPTMPLQVTMNPVEPSDIQSEQHSVTVSKVKLKLKPKKKVNKRLKKADSNLPMAYQKNAIKKLATSSDDEADKKEKLTMDNAFDDPEELADNKKYAKVALTKDTSNDNQYCAKTEPGVETEAKVTEKTSSVVVDDSQEQSNSDRPKSVGEKKFTPSLAGPERANNLVEGTAAHLAFQNIHKVPENTVIYGEGVMSLNKTKTGNNTYFTEYNLPCCLRRCKFPKKQDIEHELKINKLKKRNFIAPLVHPGLDPKLAYLAEEAQLEQFYLELKDYNHHDRLLTSRMGGTIVYKVLDEVWDRYLHKFQIKIFNGVFLECRPSGYSHNDQLIYSRTGKVCGFKTFPEDEVRCQAVLQAWNKDYCLCVYANKIFTVQRDNKQWEQDLEEVRRYLEKIGY